MSLRFLSVEAPVALSDHVHNLRYSWDCFIMIPTSRESFSKMLLRCSSPSRCCCNMEYKASTSRSDILRLPCASRPATSSVVTLVDTSCNLPLSGTSSLVATPSRSARACLSPEARGCWNAQRSVSTGRSGLWSAPEGHLPQGI
eukprot:scaffold319_cov244-Pinguiococcus_pyrenoidosus.AAC.20